MDDKLIKLICDLADKIEQNNDAIDVLEDDLIEEIIATGYGCSVGERNASVNKCMELFLHLKEQKDAKTISLYLKTLLENMIYIQDIQRGWADKCNILLAQQSKQTLENRLVKIKMDVRELFAQQNKSVSEFAYNRLDTIVRYLAVENYYGKNDYGFMLYGKMQGARMGQDYVAHSIEKYKTLIASFDKMVMMIRHVLHVIRI